MLTEAPDVSCDVERVPPETAEDTTPPVMHPKGAALLQFDRYIEAYCPKQLSGFLFVAGRSNPTRQRARGGARAREGFAIVRIGELPFPQVLCLLVLLALLFYCLSPVICTD